MYANILKSSKKHTNHVTNPRSEFLSQLMRVVSSDDGASAISAFKDSDITRFRKAMDIVTDRLVTIINDKSKANIKKYGLPGAKAGVYRAPAEDKPIPPANPMSPVKPQSPEFAKQPAAPKPIVNTFAKPKPISSRGVRALDGLTTPRQNDKGFSCT